MNTLIKIFAFCGLLAAATPAVGQVHLNITFGPPEPRQEIVIAQPNPGAVWIAGYYQYNPLTARYVWVPGHWSSPPAAGQTWVAPHYVKHGNHYDYYAGGWHDNGKHKGWYKNRKAEEKEEAHGKHER
jgi:hypothetical protein